MKYYLVIIFIISSFVFSKSVGAKQSEEFINFLSRTIYTDCHGERLIIKKDSLLDFRNGVHLRTIKEEAVENYNVAFIKEILEIFDSREKFPYFIIINGEKKFIDTITPTASFPLPDGTIKEIQFDGREILKCGSHILDISGTDYSWDSKKVELPRSIFTINIIVQILFPISIVFNLFFLIKCKRGKMRNIMALIRRLRRLMLPIKNLGDLIK